MENLDKIFTLIATKTGIGLNPDILETGVLNILALIGILLLSTKDSLKSYLEQRQNTISQNIKDAEKRLKEAEERLSEAQKQLFQADVLFNEIQAETIATKKFMLKTDLLDAQKDLKSRFERAITAFKSTERLIFFEIKEQITSLVLNRTVSRVKETFSKEKSGINLINKTIRTLDLPS